METVLTVLLALIILGLLAWAALYVLAYLVVGAIVLIGLALNVIFSSITIRKEVNVTIQRDQQSSLPPGSDHRRYGSRSPRLN